MTDSHRATEEPASADGTSRRHGVNRRRFLGTTAVGATTVATAGCLDTYESVVGSSGGDEPVTIGVLAPEPESDPTGRAIVRSATVARNLLNDDDGIDGKPVELVIGDTNGSPLEAERQYERLILDEGADVTVGMAKSEALEGIIDNIAEQETLHITAGAATSSVSELVREEYEDYKYHFRAGPVNDFDLGQAQIDFLDDMAGDLGWDSIALLAEDYEWSQGPWETFRTQQTELDADIVLEERYPPAIDDFSDLYDEVEAAGADAVFISTAHTGTDALLDWAGTERPFEFGGIHVPLQYPNYYDATNEQCRFAVGQSSAPLGADITEETSTFEDAFQSTHGVSTPIYTGYFAYDAITLYAEAVEQAGTRESGQLVDVLEDISFTGSAGEISFYGKDHDYPHDLEYRKGETIYFQWQETDGSGSQEVIWPPEHATSEYVEPDWL
ncbi:ABC transporter substrate-binding protein [Halopiger djelfimassiliensis]|uniref:ABC transporter substrate-binding protein n=1 Tax=Halopiger djelfimassiliensis TaxID=1293047 RepID=UPI000677DA97|nr:ABC transporter substrate-binding protein [Halopiger djelfimassiliensis]